MSAPGAEGFLFACPVCRGPLERTAEAECRCARDQERYRRAGGVWRLLAPGRAGAFERFVREYEAVRRAEGRGAEAADFYLALPFRDSTGRFEEDWRIRAKSFRVLVERVVGPLEAGSGRPLRVLDLGAGNGWLAHRLAERAHRVAAVDLLTNDFDGLGAHVRHRSGVAYPGGGAVVPVQAEFDRLPFAPGQFDLAVFNGSLHYSTSYPATLGEALRALRPEGRLVVMDSPVYRDGSSGARMVREREERFEREYGFRSNAVPSEGYLTHRRLAELAEELRLRWRAIEPFYGLRWAARPWTARLLGRREPARFLVVVGERSGR